MHFCHLSLNWNIPYFSDVHSPDVKCYNFIAITGHPQEHDPLLHESET